MGISRRHEYLYRRESFPVNGRVAWVMLIQNGEQESGRLLFTRNSTWGSPYDVFITSGFEGKLHRISAVVARDLDTGAFYNLTKDETRQEPAKYAEREGWFESKAEPLPYHRFVISFTVETLNANHVVVAREQFNVEMHKDYHEYWGVDGWDALMSV